MTNFYAIDKNQYPYQTVHTERCGSYARSRYAQPLGLVSIGRFDTIRTDWCNKCFPATKVEGVYGDMHPDKREFLRIKNEADEKRRAEERDRRLAREIASLIVELSKRLSDASPEVTALANTYVDEIRSGAYTGLIGR